MVYLILVILIVDGKKRRQMENYVPYFLSALIVNYIYFSHCVEHKKKKHYLINILFCFI